MDYKKSGGARPGRSAPRHQEKNAPGGPGNPFGSGAKAKGAKAGAAKDDREHPGKGGRLDRPQTGAEDFAIDEQDGKPIRGPEEISNDNDTSAAKRDD